MSKRPQGGLVYSTDSSRNCPKCGWPATSCRYSRGPDVKAGDGIVRVGRETKGRAGKGVTVITGVPLAGDDLGKLASDLKRRCGTGGTVKDGTIEIQGDHRDAMVEELTRRGYKVKRAGG